MYSYHEVNDENSLVLALFLMHKIRSSVGLFESQPQERLTATFLVVAKCEQRIVSFSWYWLTVTGLSHCGTDVLMLSMEPAAG